MSQWISLSERKPDYAGHFLVWRSDFEEVEIFSYTPDINTWDGGAYAVEPEHLTHWMPLPSPPEKEKEETNSKRAGTRMVK